MRGSTNRRILTIVTGVLAVAIVAFLAVGLILPNSWPGQVLRGSAIQSGGAEPTYASAAVDGSIAEWDLTNDLFTSMHRAWKPSKPIETNLYLRYDCPSSTMYALVLTAGSWPVLVNGDPWISIDGIDNKVTFTNFAWVDQGYDGDSNHAKGWEASFSLDQGDYTIAAHINVDHDGSQTSGTPNKNVGMTVICGGSTAVDLTYFEAEWAKGLAASEGAKAGAGVVLRWETATELDNVGFNVYRSTEKGAWIKLNRELIPSQVPPGSPTGATYEFSDPEARPGDEWSYLLEDVDVNGTVTQHGPVQPQ